MDTFTQSEIDDLVPLARAAVDTEENPWTKLGQYFRDNKEQASQIVEPRQKPVSK